ncbi:DUF397 domain-containing protein [Kitasatospora sp. NPDC093558]|uniref:DUF397 domain-containing protein n=1 Tax=Kitasatospora sp. NPDC093558 TaxID=3155201 RepID=UPI00342D3649
MDESYGSKFERLSRQPPRDYAERCDKLFKTGKLLVEAWDAVDWASMPSSPDRFQFFTDLEARADQVREYDTARISGLLQTPAYARALHRFVQPDATAEKIELDVKARMSRQTRFLAPQGPFLIAVLDEAVIRQHVGGRVVMQYQLQHLLDVPKRHPNIVIQVAPFELGERTGVAGGFTLLELPDGERWAYSESMSRGHAVSDPATIGKQIRAYDQLRADALSATESARLIARVKRELVNVSTTGPISVSWNPPREWKTASYSQGDGGQCVEVATNVAVDEGVVPVRDSKDRSGPELEISAAGWSAFIAAIRAGEFGTV